ncbi:hypothetical protein G7Y89_g15021 [Cudoniella acicularis]|uniref:Uncharacterized protein n=1 Tax=Cudoniella acicularis TaxID=354080 RepID=A0A8H4QX71_9HELO|nr:hypothetical protein G7Y89_g15021 [Cudoniella acicularis]
MPCVQTREVKLARCYKHEDVFPRLAAACGKWLWNEEKELRERDIKFNVEELKRIATESIGAKSCVSMVKLTEGKYNKLFKLVMDNSSVAIARIPCPNAGPAFKTTASEVATLEFASYP